MSFEQNLEKGQIGESIIANWLAGEEGWNVLPAYDIENPTGKGPRLLTDAGQLIVPDMLAFKNNEYMWIEAKTKSAFTWYRKTDEWQTGIDYTHFEAYISVFEKTKIPVYILFLHKPGSKAMDTPSGMVSPTGLYGQEISNLQKSVDHKDVGMVYWNESSLIKIGEFYKLNLMVDSFDKFREETR